MFIFNFSKDDNDYFVLYNRAKAYVALKEYERALNDATEVVILRPHWAKVRL